MHPATWDLRNLAVALWLLAASLLIIGLALRGLDEMLTAISRRRSRPRRPH